MAQPREPKTMTNIKLLPSSNMTFAKIAELAGDTLSEWKTYNFDNGAQVKTYRSPTYHKGGILKTAYLHITIQYPSGYVEYYREQKDGSFKTR